jgi:hypothetical protein
MPGTPLTPGRSVATTRDMRWAFFALLQIAAVAVFFSFDALPFQDLPAHAGLIALRDRLSDAPLEQRYWVVAPHLGGYSLFRGLGHALAAIGGAGFAVRVIGALPVVLMPASLVFARWRLYRELEPGFAFAGTMLSFGLMTALGFASFLVALPLLVVTFAIWLEVMAGADRGEPARGQEVLAGALAAAVVLAHGFAFVLLLVVCASATVAAGRPRARLVRLRCLLPSLALAGSSAILEVIHRVPAGSAALSRREPPMHFQGPLDKLSLLVTPTMTTRTGIDIALGLLLWAWAGAALWHGRRTDRAAGATCAGHARAVRVAAATIFALFVVLPHAVGWFAFVDGRLVPLVLALALVSAPWRVLPGALRSAFDRFVPWCAAAMVTLVLWASAAFQHEASGYREVLGCVPAGSRLLNLPLEPDSRIFTAHPFIHYDKLVLVDRPIVPSDVWFHQGSALYPTSENPATRLPVSYSESNLRAIEWPSYDLADWDFVLIRTAPASGEPTVPPSLSPVRHEGGWWLYQVAIRG